MWNIGLRIFGVAGVIAGLLLLWNWLWFSPEIWNGTAARYHDHATKLGADSVVWVRRAGIWHKDSVALRDTIATRDSLIDYQRGEWQKSIDYGLRWQDKYASQIAIKDAVTDQLTDREAELAYYRALLNNQTLPRAVGDIALLKPSNPLVVKAGLKTADREAVGKRSLDSLAESVGLMATATERLGRGLTIASIQLGQISANARQDMKGGIPIIRHRRRKQLKRVAEKADSAKQVIDKISALEIDLNKLKQRP